MMPAHHKVQQVPGRALFISVIALELGVVFDICFYGKLPGISFPLYVTFVLAVLLLVARRFRVQLPRTALLLTPAILVFAWLVFLRAGGLITFLNIAMTLFLSALFLGLIFRPNIRQYVFSDYLDAVFLTLGQVLEQAPKPIAEAFSGRKAVRKHEASAQIVRGILITVPILLVFILLFSSADLVFSKYTHELFDFQLSADWIFRIILILLVSFGFAGVLGYLTAGRSARRTEEQPAAAVKPWLGSVEVTILFSSLNVLFLTFIAVQLRYLFGGEQNVTVQGFTYAEYARKGFFELIAVALLSFVVVRVAERLLARKGDRHTSQFKFLAGALVAQVMIIMISAFNRLSLYESAYGFTSLRLYSHLSIVWLAVVFCFLLYKIFIDQREHVFAYLAFLSILGFLLMVNVLNVDAFVARKNIARFESTHKLDLGYLSELSDDGVKETTRLLDSPNPKVREDTAGMLYRRYYKLQAKNEHWQSANLARQSAQNALEAKKDLLEQNKDNDFYRSDGLYE